MEPYDYTSAPSSGLKSQSYAQKHKFISLRHIFSELMVVHIGYSLSLNRYNILVFTTNAGFLRDVDV